MHKAGREVTILKMDENTNPQSNDEALRRVLLETVGGLVNIEAAMECICGCHPRVGTYHNEGRDCPCQKTPEERRLVIEEFWNKMDEIHSDPEYIQREAEAEEAFRQESENLQVEIYTHGGYAPHVITGNVDGYEFYYRERGDIYRVVVADEPGNAQNPWGSSEVSSQVAGEGVIDDESSENYPIWALRTAVESARQHLLQRKCEHREEGGPWCPDCGTLIGFLTNRGER